MPLARITPCLWFDHQAEEAAHFYCSVFPNARIDQVSRYSDVGQAVHGQPPGSVMVVAFELDGQAFTAFNGGPVFQFNQAISLQVLCADQPEIDYYWDRLGEGGEPAAQQCGWLKDRYGLSWQILPKMLANMMADPDQTRANRVMAALLPMKRLNLAALQRAYLGNLVGV